jgi:hypothetical protein
VEKPLMTYIESLERDIARVENNLAQLQLRKQLAEIDRKLILLSAASRLHSSTDRPQPPQGI